jgi:preprotein translocase SecE subunit
MVGLTLFGFALAGGFFFTHVFTELFAHLRWNDTELFGALAVTSLLGFGLAAVGGVWAWFNAKVRANGLDIAAELNKVTWPSAAETRVSTIAVVVASVVCAAVLFVFDFVASKVMTVWVPQGLTWVARL